MRRVCLLVVLAIGVFGQGVAKRPLNHRDPDAWRSIQRPTLSRDGRWLAYGLFPQEGDGEFVVRDLRTGKEKRGPAGSLPPPPDPTIERDPDEPPPQGIRISFTSDN